MIGSRRTANLLEFASSIRLFNDLTFFSTFPHLRRHDQDLAPLHQ